MKFLLKLSKICSLLLLVNAQFDSFEIFDLIPSSNNNKRPLISTTFYNTNDRQSNSNFNANNRFDGTGTNCDSLWSIQNDYTGPWGQLAVPSTDQSKAVLRVVLSVAARLPSVSKL